MAFIKRGQNIPIHINSFFDKKDRDVFKNSMLKIADSNPSIRQRLGEQKLYEEPEDVIKRYMDNGFDIVEVMKEKPDSFLFVRARAIDADVPNENGDCFPMEELIKEREIKTADGVKKIPAYKTFEGCRIYTNHQNDDVAQAKGLVIYAEIDEENKCVWCTFYIDSDAYPDITRGIQQGYITDVSMGTQVEWSECSICKNRAEKESEWCEHLKNYKGKKFSGRIEEGPRKGEMANNELAYEINHDLKFIELSIVSDGAFEPCKIEKILPHGEVIAYAETLKNKAGSLSGAIGDEKIKISESNVSPSSIEFLDILNHTNSLAEKIAGFSSSIMKRSADMGGEVGMVSVLDTLNDVLNKIEVVIVSLLTRKDTIDLGHVAKLSKAMADIQQEVSDMIDDGIGIATNKALPQWGSPNVPPVTPEQADTQYVPGGDVGTVMMPSTPPEQQQMVQPQSNIIDGSPYDIAIDPNVIPGGVVTASQPDSWSRLSSELESVNTKLDETISENFIKNSTIDKGGHGKMPKNLFEMMGNNLTKRSSSIASLKYEETTEDEKFKIVISSNGEVVGKFNNKDTNWSPAQQSISEEDIENIKAGRVHLVGNKFLNEFVKEANNNNVRYASGEPITPSDVQEVQLGDKRTGNPKDVQEVQIGDKRTGSPKDVQEVQIGDKRTGNPTDVQEVQLGQGEADPKIRSRSGHPNDVQEHQIEDNRIGVDNRVWEHKLENKRSAVKGVDKIVSAALNAAASAIVDSYSSPSDAIDALHKFSDDIENSMEKVSSVATEDIYKKRVARRERVKYGLDENNAIDINDALIERIADIVIENPNEASLYLNDVIKHIASSDKEEIKEIIGKTASKISNKQPLAKVNDNYSVADIIRGAITSKTVEDDDSLNRNHIKIAMVSSAQVAADMKLTADDILEVVKNTEDLEAVSMINSARHPDAIEKRKRAKARAEFWRQAKSVEENIDENNIKTALFETIADNVEKETSSNMAWNALKKMASAGDAGRVLINSGIQRIRQAAVSMTDRTVVVRDVRMHIDDIPNANPSDEDYEDSVRQFVISFLTDKGYQVDPSTFAFTSLSIDENTGEICAVVESSINKTLKETSVDRDRIDRDIGESSLPTEDIVEEMPPIEEESFGGIVEPTPINDNVGDWSESFLPEETLMTPLARKNRRNRREAMLRAAQGFGGQMAPVPNQPSPPTGAMGGMDPNLPPQTPLSGPGVAALEYGGPEMDDTEEGAPNMDHMSVPGEKKPIGSICPHCGSTNVDLAAGRGECGDCGTSFEVKISLDNIQTPEDGATPDEDSATADATEGLDEILESAEDAGMPGAPGGMPGEMPGGMPGGLPPMMASISWYTKPEVFAKFANSKRKGVADNKIKGRKPIGACVLCGNKNIKRASSKYFCNECDTIGVFDIKPSKKHPSYLISNVKVLLPYNNK